MYFREALRVLGLEDTDEDELTKDAVRRQYMRKLREHPPERDPEGFQRLREAFDAVKNYFPDRKERRPEPEPEVAPPPSLFIDAAATPAPPSATEYVVGKGAREDVRARDDVKARETVAPAPPISNVDDGEAEGPGSSGQYSFRGKRVLEEDDDLDADEHEHEHEHDRDEDSTDGQYSLRGSGNSKNEDDEEAASSGQYSFRGDEIDDEDDLDEDDDEDEDEDEDEDDDDGEYERPQSEADAAFVAEQPAMSLEDLVEKILKLLEHEEVEAALEVQASWRDDADTDDHRRTNHYVAIRWALTRELLAVARDLPLYVVRLLARGIAANDLSTVKVDLEAYRRRAPEKASDANAVLAKRAPDLHKQLGGALYVPPPKREYFTNVPQFTVPDVRSSSGKGAGTAIWMVLGVIVLFARIMASSSSRSSHYDIDIPKFDYHAPNIDYDALSRLSNYNSYGNDGYGSDYDSLYAPPEPPEFHSTADRDTQLAEIDTSLDALTTYPNTATNEQVVKLALFRAARNEENCPRMLKRFARLEELPVSTEKHAAVGDRHIRAIRERLDAVCTDKKPAKKLDKKVRKKAAPKTPPPATATETAEQP